MTTPDDLYDEMRAGEALAGQIVTDIYDDFWAQPFFRYGTGEYDLIGSDEGAVLLGYGQDDPYLTLLQRKSDGQLFEIEIEVTARAVQPVPPEQPDPGQGELPIEVTP
jgi:hypothetical protein